MASERAFSDPALIAFAAAQPGIAFRERTVAGAGGVRLHVVEAGSEMGPPVFLLHGFPEFWWGWRKQIPALAAAGLRLVVPDLRGFNRSDKPRGVAAYRLGRLIDDLLALFDATGVEKARVAAHDWGAALAWSAIERHPERFERLAILNAPHLSVLKKALIRSSEQRRRGSYLFYFQLPYFPERRIARAGFRAFRSIFKRSSPPGTFTSEELEVYSAAAQVPGALTAMLHWYRAAFWFPPPRRRHGLFSGARITPPVRLIWGTGDVALPEALIEPTMARCESCELVKIEGAGHWVTHTAAAEVNRLLLEFLA